MKKVLIITVTAGSGHNVCANFMKEKLEKKGDVEIKVVDLLYAYSTKLRAWVADGGYNFVVGSGLLPLYDKYYNHYKKAKPEDRYSCATQKTVISTLDGLLKEILEFQPDVIYSTHFYGAIAITDLKLVYDLPCKTIVTNLDYVYSPFWEAGIGVDYFSIPHEDFIAEGLRKGYTREQLVVTGLPIDERTLDKLNTQDARKQLGLDEDVFTIMVMFGGGCWGGAFEIFKDLLKELKGRKVQIIMVNGRDENSYNKIEKMTFEEGIKVVNLGYTKTIPLDYLSAADVVINKCGGSGLTVIINREKPMILTEKSPAQEKYNLEYMKEKGVAVGFKNGKELGVQVRKLMDNPQLLKTMAQKTKSLRKDSLNQVAELILSMPKADYSKIVKQKIDFKEVKKKVAQAMKKADKKEREKCNIKKVKKLTKVGEL